MSLSQLEIHFFDSRGWKPITLEEGGTISVSQTGFALRGLSDQRTGGSTGKAMVTLTDSEGRSYPISHPPDEAASGELERFGAKISVDIIYNQAMALSDGDETINFTVLFEEENLTSRASFSEEEEQLFALVDTGGATETFIKGTISYNGFEESFRSSVTGDQGRVRVKIAEIFSGWIRVDGEVIFYGPRGSKRNLPLRLFPGEGADLRSVFPKENHSPLTQLLANEFPRWSHGRKTDIHALAELECRRLRGEKISELLEEGPSVLQREMNRVYGVPAQRFLDRSQDLVSSLFRESFPMETRGLFYRVETPRGKPAPYITINDFRLLENGSSASSGSSATGSTLRWDYSQPKEKFLLEFQATLTHSQSTKSACPDVGIELTLNNGRRLFAGYSPGTSSYDLILHSDIQIFFQEDGSLWSSGTTRFFRLEREDRVLRISSEGKRFPEVLLDPGEEIESLSVVSFRGTGVRTIQLSAFRFIPGAETSLHLVNAAGVAYRRVGSFQALQDAPTDALEAISSGEYYALREKRSGAAILPKRTTLDQFGNAYPVAIRGVDHRIEVLSGQAFERVALGDLLYRETVLSDPLFDVAVTRNRGYALTETMVIEFDHRLPDPFLSFGHFIVLAVLPNPVPGAQQLDADLEGRLWFS